MGSKTYSASVRLPTMTRASPFMPTSTGLSWPRFLNAAWSKVARAVKEPPAFRSGAAAWPSPEALEGYLLHRALRDVEVLLGFGGIELVAEQFNLRDQLFVEQFFVATLEIAAGGQVFFPEGHFFFNLG